MKNYTRTIIVFALIAGIFTSCVSPRLLEDEKKKRASCEEERDILRTSRKDLETANTELTSNNETYKKQIFGLTTDTTVIGTTLRKMKMQYDKINELNDELLRKQKQRNMDNASETRKLLSELQAAQNDLQMREDKLKDMERALDLKKKNLEELQVALKGKDSELERKNKRLLELEDILNKKDAAVLALKNNITQALKGYEGKGLKIHEKNGKVYVSLDEKLLFKSGKWNVDPKGQKALKDLAKVLATNSDINIMIEGHTDDVAYNGTSGISDNWDLSVKRATSIVKILLTNKDIEPSRIIAAGRGEFLPLDDAKTKLARQTNRRTEIILTPKLDELFKMLENN